MSVVIESPPEVPNPDVRPGRMRIAMLAPPWIPVPPPGYGGIEAVIATLTQALGARGHDVTLFGAPGSRSGRRTVEPVPGPLPETIGGALCEADHVSTALERIELGLPEHRPYDVIHDHCDAVMLAMADRTSLPVVHTAHGPFTPAVRAFHRRRAGSALVVGLSEAQLATAPSELEPFGAIPNPVDLDALPLATGRRDYLVWIGRCNEEKGPHRAIDIARRAGKPVILAGVVQPGQEEWFARNVEPHLDGHRARFIGEVGGERKRALLQGASALLMPIRWPEPFGMVMAEAMACGTPVLAFPEGSAPELVHDGVTGFLGEDERDLARLVSHVDQIDPAACRGWVARRCAPDVVAARYEEAYRAAIASEPVPAFVRGTTLAG